MLAFDFTRRREKSPELIAGELLLRPPVLADHGQWAFVREQSREHLTRWEPVWRSGDLSLDAFRTRLRMYERVHRLGAGLSLLIFDRRRDALVGGVTLSDIRRHAAQSATIGYWVGVNHLRQGLGSAAVGRVLEHAFGEMQLNRIEAACQSGNTPSRRLLVKCGFFEEGFARDYLFINGAWRDHILFAATRRHYLGTPLAGETWPHPAPAGD